MIPGGGPDQKAGPRTMEAGDPYCFLECGRGVKGKGYRRLGGFASRSTAAASRRAECRLNRLGVLRNDDKQGARRAFRLPMTLFPVLDRIQREAESGGKLRLAQSHPGAQFSHIYSRRWNVRDPNTRGLAIYPVARLLRTSKQLVSQRTAFNWFLPARLLHFSFSLQSDFRARSCLASALRYRVDISVWMLFVKIAIKNTGTSTLWK